MRAYSLDLCVRVFADYDAGLTFAQLGRKYSVSAEWVRQIVRRRERTGEVAARRPIPKRVPFRATHEAALRQFVAALRTTGLTAPMVVDGAINGDVFVAYVEQVLVRTLKPGDVVVMDNLSSH